MTSPGNPEKIVVVVGPTCVGKTRVSMQLAKMLRGEIVSADSMQVYRGMDIGTAKPSVRERQTVAHHLIDSLEPDVAFDAKRFQEEADRAIRSIRERNLVPIVVGGTGLYVKSLLHGLFSDNVRERHATWQERLDAYRRLGEDPHAVLLRVDPVAAAGIHPRDRVRAQRALDVFLRTGESIKEMRERHAFLEDRYDALTIGLRMDRTILRERIDARVDGMIRDGLMEEVRSLLYRGFSPDLPSMQCLGYRHMAAVILGKASLSESVEKMKRETRQYSKRQLTWFRNQERVEWFDQPVSIEALVDRVRSFLGPE